MQEEYCPLSMTQPVLDYLITHMASTASLGEILGGAPDYHSDLHYMRLAMSRFMHKSSPFHTFDNELPELLAVLDKYCAGHFTHRAGTTWEPGKPMHLDHLMSGFLRLFILMERPA